MWRHTPSPSDNKNGALRHRVQAKLDQTPDLSPFTAAITESSGSSMANSGQVKSACVPKFANSKIIDCLEPVGHEMIQGCARFDRAGAQNRCAHNVGVNRCNRQQPLVAA